MLTNSVTTWILALVLSFGWPSVSLFSCQSKETDSAQRRAAVPIKQVSHNPEKYLKEIIRVTGRLENEGKNYFTDLRVVLKDREGNALHVQPWLPLSLPPSPKPGPAQKPPTLSQFLGKEVELVAVLDRATVKNIGEVYVLNVQSARIIQQ